MSTVSPRPRRPRRTPAENRPPLLASERAMLAAFDTERRLHLLRLILFPLLILTALALPFAVQADRGSASMQSTLQTGTGLVAFALDRKSTRLNSSHANISYAVFCLKK